MLDLLEKHNVLCKTGGGMPKPVFFLPPPVPQFDGGKVSRMKKAKNCPTSQKIEHSRALIKGLTDMMHMTEQQIL